MYKRYQNQFCHFISFKIVIELTSLVSKSNKLISENEFNSINSTIRLFRGMFW